MSTASTSRLALFLRSAVFDFIFALIASTALTMTVGFGFSSAPDLVANPWVCAGLAVPMLFICFAGSWSKRALVPAAALALVYAFAAIAALSAGSSAELFVDGALNDSAESNFVFAVVALAVPALVYVLSRRRGSALLLLFASILACEVIQFLYRDWAASGGTAVSLIGIAAVFALFVFQGYRSSVRSASHAGRISFSAASVFSALVSVVCMGLGLAVFFGIIAGLGLSTPQVKPFKDYFSRPIIEYSANYTRQPVDDPNTESGKLSKHKSTTSKNAPGGVLNQSPQEQEKDSATKEVESGSKQVNDNNNWNEQNQTISYTALALTALLIAVPVLLIALAIILLRRRQRRRRLWRIADKPYAYRVWWIYCFMCERLRRVGYARPETLTPMEYAMASRATLAPYSQGCDVDFLALTLLYQRAAYDEGRVTEEDYAAAERYYWAFYKNARKQCSWYKWAFWRFWRL